MENFGKERLFSSQEGLAARKAASKIPEVGHLGTLFRDVCPASNVFYEWATDHYRNEENWIIQKERCELLPKHEIMQLMKGARKRGFPRPNDTYHVLRDPNRKFVAFYEFFTDMLQAGMGFISIHDFNQQARLELQPAPARRKAPLNGRRRA